MVSLYITYFINFISRSSNVEKLDTILQSTSNSVIPKAPQPEAKLQPCELIKQDQQVNKYNAWEASFDKTDKQLQILRRNELEWYKKMTPLNKQYKISHRSRYYCGKKRYLLSRRPYFDIC